MLDLETVQHWRQDAPQSIVDKADHQPADDAGRRSAGAFHTQICALQDRNRLGQECLARGRERHLLPIAVVKIVVDAERPNAAEEQNS